MSQVFTKSMARNIFYGGGMFFFLLFLVLTFDTINTLPKRDNRAAITPVVAKGKLLWEENDCIGCHTLLGEGAYFAPELGNIYTRYGNSKEAIKGFIMSRPKDGTRHALKQARDLGLQPFRVTVDQQAGEYLPHLFGSGGYVVIHRPSQLPRELPLLYARLTA
jgi:nitric oxide reductase subunit C